MPDRKRSLVRPPAQAWPDALSCSVRCRSCITTALFFEQRSIVRAIALREQGQQVEVIYREERAAIDEDYQDAQHVLGWLSAHQQRARTNGGCKSRIIHIKVSWRASDHGWRSTMRA
jgi:hypothetical protein